VHESKDRFKLPARDYQLVDTAAVVDHEFYGLFLDMRLGKTKIIIDAACILREELKVNVILVVSPSPVRGVWIDEDPELGEIKKHSWLPSRVFEFHNPVRLVWQDKEPQLDWVITNFEFLRSEEHREDLKRLLYARQVMMVLDESSFVKSRSAAQTKACLELGKLATRRYILNGTPVTQSPLDLWSQMNFLSPRILPYKNFFHFRSDYAVLGGWHNKQITRYQNLDKLQVLVAPHVIRRDKKDHLNIPTVETHVEVPLSAETWKIYKDMKNEAVVWMEENPSMAAQAGVRIMRLSQIVGGFLGGFIQEEGQPEVIDGHERSGQTREIGREKLSWLKVWVAQRLEEDPTQKIITWCRFRPEIERVAEELRPLLPTYKLYGQGKAERTEARERFSKLGNDEPALLAAQPQAGGYGLNLIVANINVYLSHDYSLMRYLQSKERSAGPGQTKSVLYVDVLATGPKGEKTIDHTIVKALRKHHDMAQWTCSAWKRALEEE
jgi:SNF2 family DNA or RNA helicase